MDKVPPDCGAETAIVGPGTLASGGVPDDDGATGVAVAIGGAIVTGAGDDGLTGVAVVIGGRIVTDAGCDGLTGVAVVIGGRVLTGAGGDDGLAGVAVVIGGRVVTGAGGFVVEIGAGGDEEVGRESVALISSAFLTHAGASACPYDFINGNWTSDLNATPSTRSRGSSAAAGYEAVTVTTIPGFAPLHPHTPYRFGLSQTPTATPAVPMSK